MHAAAEGYVVFAPFHADARYSRIKLNTINDYFCCLSRYPEVAEMQRPPALGLKQECDCCSEAGYASGTIDHDQLSASAARSAAWR